MEKALCFYIDGAELFLEQVLVDYMDIPIFFLCKSEKEKYYVVLCTDTEKLDYIIVNPSVSEISAMLHGTITMREIILRQEQFWEVSTGENIENDKVTQKGIENIEVQMLPDEGACFKILTDAVKEYVNYFDNILYSGQFSKVRVQEMEESFIEEGSVLDVDYYLGEDSVVEKYMPVYDVGDICKVVLEKMGCMSHSENSVFDEAVAENEKVFMDKTERKRIFTGMAELTEWNVGENVNFESAA